MCSRDRCARAQASTIDVQMPTASCAPSAHGHTTSEDASSGADTVSTATTPSSLPPSRFDVLDDETAPPATDGAAVLLYVAMMMVRARDVLCCVRDVMVIASKRAANEATLYAHARVRQVLHWQRVCGVARETQSKRARARMCVCAIH
jgi:hypothetical protein